MTLEFQKIDSMWVSEFEAPADFNLHIEKPTGKIRLFQRTAGTKYDGIDEIDYTEGNSVFDYDFTALVYPKTIKIESEVEPTLAVVTSDGETTQIGGGNSMIEFSVNGTTYQAEEGMTWAEFVESEYNDGTFGTMGTNYVKPALAYEGGYVKLDSKIVAGYDYAFAPI